MLWRGSSITCCSPSTVEGRVSSAAPAEFSRSRRCARIRFADWSLDTAQRQLISAASVVTPLSGAEFRLLRIFLSHPNRVLTRDQLVDLTQGKEADPLDRSIDVQVSRLRHRLGDDPREPRLIKTVRGEGYVLAVDGRAEP